MQVSHHVLVPSPSLPKPRSRPSAFSHSTNVMSKTEEDCKKWRGSSTSSIPQDLNLGLGATLDVGSSLNDAKSSLILRECSDFSPTRYFVEEVITCYDETNLHRSWVRAEATARSPEKMNTRLENMCWRIWILMWVWSLRGI
ncbi:hypothetical protein ACFX1X_046351 [Malus domestica]